MSWTSSRPYPKTPRGFRIDDTVTGRVVASGTVANDAQLQMIAAAPDMYAALGAIVDAAMDVNGGPDMTGYGALMNAVTRARDALTKAEEKS